MDFPRKGATDATDRQEIQMWLSALQVPILLRGEDEAQEGQESLRTFVSYFDKRTLACTSIFC
jgi:hypothetical protein